MQDITVTNSLSFFDVYGVGSLLARPTYEYAGSPH
tara:strand:- start:274 stop:378 length:105 start_codon:yes stop_codon:yes gene_type:complete